MSQPAQASVQVCAACGETADELDPRSRCPCGGLRALRHIAPAERGAALQAVFESRLASREAPARSGVWRCRELVLPSADDPVSHPEGKRQLLERAAISRWTGAARLLLKHEGLNPTGSFKDRGMTVGVTQARPGRARGGVRLDRQHLRQSGRLRRPGRHYRAGRGSGREDRAGQAGADPGVRSPHAAGAGGFRLVHRLVQEAEARLGIYLLNSVNPFRIEGQKTIVFETAASSLGWDPPDWIVVAGGQPGQHGGVRRRVARRARAGTDRPDAPARGGAGGGRGALRPGFSQRIHPAGAGAAGNGGDGDPDRRPRIVGSRSARHPGDGRRGDRCPGPGHPGGEGGGGYGWSGLRTGQRGERGGGATAGAGGNHRAGSAGGRSADRPPAQGSGGPLRLRPIEIDPTLAEVERAMV